MLLKQAAGIPMEKKKGGEVIPAEEKTKEQRQVQGLQGDAGPGARHRQEEDRRTSTPATSTTPPASSKGPPAAWALAVEG